MLWNALLIFKLLVSAWMSFSMQYKSDVTNTNTETFAESCSWQGVLDTTLCDAGCQWLAVSGFLWVLGVSSTKQNWLWWYNWNIVESRIQTRNFSGDRHGLHR
jgi:hypothetical protein